MIDDAMTKTEALIAREEGFRSRPYRCPAGKLTIGYGWNLDAGITRAQALVIMRSQIDNIREALNAKFPWFVGLSEARQAVLISMAFQMGLAGLYGFVNTLKFIGAGQYDRAAQNMLASKWARQTHARARRAAVMMRTGEFT